MAVGVLWNELHKSSYSNTAKVTKPERTEKKKGRQAGWKCGRKEGWKEGKMEGWKEGRERKQKKKLFS